MGPVSCPCRTDHFAGVHFALASAHVSPVPLISGLELVAVFSSVTRSLKITFSQVPRFVSTFSRAACSLALSEFVFSSRSDSCCFQSLCTLALPSALALVERFNRIGIRIALVHRRLEILILGCRLLTLKLLRSWPFFLSICRRSSLFCSRFCLYPTISTVKARTVSVHILGERIIDVGIMDNGLIHMCHSGVVL